MGERALAATTKFALDNLKTSMMEESNSHCTIGLSALRVQKSLLEGAKTQIPQTDQLGVIIKK